MEKDQITVSDPYLALSYIIPHRNKDPFGICSVSVERKKRSCESEEKIRVK